jgi:hypothetical protein
LGADGVAVLLLLVLDDVVDHDDGGAVVGDPAGEEALEAGGVGVGVEVVAVHGHGFGDAVDDDEGAAGEGWCELVAAGVVEGPVGADVGEVVADLVGGGAEGEEAAMTRSARSSKSTKVTSLALVESWRAARRQSQVLPDSDSPETVWTAPA